MSTPAEQKALWLYSTNPPFARFPKVRDKPDSWHGLFLYGENLLEVKESNISRSELYADIPESPLRTEALFLTPARSIICQWSTDSPLPRNNSLLKELLQPYIFFCRGRQTPMTGQCRDTKAYLCSLDFKQFWSSRAPLLWELLL